MKGIEIFKAGSHTDSSGRPWVFSADVIREIVEGYDPAVFASPLVVGHPAQDAPAYGWAKKLAANDAGVITLEETDAVEAQFADMVEAKRFPKVSAALFQPTDPANPTPGKWYLRHIGFLGAAAPAIPGLKPAANFSAGDDIVVIEFSAPQPTPEKTVDPTKEKEAQFAAQEEALAKREAELKAREDAIAKAAAEARTKDITAFAAQLEKDGKILPRHTAGLVAFMAVLSDDAPVTFAAADGEKTQPGATWLREFLAELPPRVDFSEHAAAEQQDAGAAATFSAPAGFDVDKSRLDLHNKIVAYQKQHNVDYATAAVAVGG